MKQKIYALQLLLILLCSCQEEIYINTDRTKLFNTDSTKEIVLSPTVVNSDLMGLKELSCHDSTLLVLSSNKREIFNIINTNSDSVVLSTGTIGRGPGEFFIPSLSRFFTTSPDGDLITNVRSSRTTIRPLNITQTINNGRVVCQEDIEDKSENALMQYISSDKIFRKTQVHPDINYGINKPKFEYFYGDSVHNFNVYPDLVPNSVEPLNTTYLYIGDIERLRPDGEKVVNCSAMLDRVIIFDLDSLKTLRVEKEGEHKMEEFKNLSNTNMMKLIQAAYHDASLTNQYIIALHDGRNRQQMENKEFKHEPTIRVFDYNGELLKQYRVKEDIIRIAYCEDNNYLYAIDMEDRLLKYKLDL